VRIAELDTVTPYQGVAGEGKRERRALDARLLAVCAEVSGGECADGSFRVPILLVFRNTLKGLS